MNIKVTPNQLLISMPQQLVRFVGLMFILIGGTLLWFTLESYQLSCQCKFMEQGHQCQLITKEIYFSSKTILLTNLQKANLSTHRTAKGNLSYNVVLNTTNKQVHLSSINTSDYIKSQAVVGQVNAFLLKCKNETLNLSSLHPLWLQLFLLVFPITGISMIVLTKNMVLTFNKVDNQLKIVRKTPFNQSEKYYPLDKISNIIIQQSTTYKGGVCYRVALILNDGTEIPLTHVYDSQLNSKLKLAKAINDFLGLNLSFASWVKKEQKQKKLAIALFIIGLLITLFVVLSPYR